MRAQFLLLALALVACSFSHAGFHNDAAATAQSVTNAIEKNLGGLLSNLKLIESDLKAHSMKSTSSFTVQAATDPCSTACTNFISKFTTCGLAAQPYIPTTTNATLADLSNAAMKLCSAGGKGGNACDDFNTAYKTASTTCSVADFQTKCVTAVVNLISGMGLGVTVTPSQIAAFGTSCMAIDGKLCINATYHAMNYFNNTNPSTFSTTILNEVCHPCVSKTLDLMAAAGTEKASTPLSLKGICTTDSSNQYCLYPSVTQASAAITNTFNSDSLTSAICTTCAKKAFSFVAASGVDSTFNFWTDTQSYACTSNSTGSRCLSNINYNAIDAVLDGACRGVSSTVCPTNCTAALHKLHHSLGCCFSSLSYMSARYYNATGEQMWKELPDAIKVCGFSDLKGCKASSTIGMSLKLKGLSYTAYTAKKASVDAALKKDISANTGVATSNIIINGASVYSAGHSWNIMAVFKALAVEQGVTFDVSIQPDSDAQVTALQTQINSGVSGFSFTNVAAATSSAVTIDATSAASVSNTNSFPDTTASGSTTPSSTSSGSDSSAGFTAVPSIATFAIIAFISLIL